MKINGKALPPPSAGLRVLLAIPTENMRDLKELLVQAGFTVDIAQSQDELKQAIAGHPSLILLPATHEGLARLRELRHQHATPIVLFGSADGADKVKALELGADDLLDLTSEPRELLARVRSLLRRVHYDKFGLESSLAERVIHFEGWRFVMRSRRLVNPDGNAVPLTTREFELLQSFVCRAGEPLSREFLMAAVAGVTWKAFDRRIDVLVSRLRKKLRQNCPNDIPLIETVRGAGYQFVGSVAYD